MHGAILGKSINWKGQGINEKGYDGETGNLIVSIDKRYFRPTEVENLLGDPSKAKNLIGHQRLHLKKWFMK